MMSVCYPRPEAVLLYIKSWYPVSVTNNSIAEHFGADRNHISAITRAYAQSGVIQATKLHANDVRKHFSYLESGD